MFNGWLLCDSGYDKNACIRIVILVMAEWIHSSATGCCINFMMHPLQCQQRFSNVLSCTTKYTLKAKSMNIITSMMHGRHNDTTIAFIMLQLTVSGCLCSPGTTEEPIHTLGAYSRNDWIVCLAFKLSIPWLVRFLINKIDEILFRQHCLEY